MSRRFYLLAVGGGALAVSGCVSAPSNDTTTGNSSVRDHTFTIVEQDDRFDGSPSEDRFEHDAAVKFDRENSSVIVTGRIQSGGRNCKATSLRSVSFDEGQELLRFTIDDERIREDGCTTSVEMVPYRAEVTLESSMPELVRVEHLDDGTLMFEEEFET